MGINRRRFIKAAAVLAGANGETVIQILSDPSQKATAEVKDIQPLIKEVAEVWKKSELAEELEGAKLGLLMIPTMPMSREGFESIEKTTEDAAKNLPKLVALHKRAASIMEDIILKAIEIEKKTGKPLELLLPGDEEAWDMASFRGSWCHAKISAGETVSPDAIKRFVGDEKAYDGLPLFETVSRTTKPLKQTLGSCRKMIPGKRACLEAIRNYHEELEQEHYPIKKATGLSWELGRQNDAAYYQAHTHGAGYTQVKRVADALSDLTGEGSQKIYQFADQKVMPAGINVPGDLMLALPEDTYHQVDAILRKKMQTPNNYQDQELFKQLKAAAPPLRKSMIL